jgi:hypothetical protein
MPSGNLGSGVPPLGGSSAGTGGAAPVNGTAQQAQGINYLLVVPSTYAGAPTPVAIYYTGTAGADFITNQFILNATGQTGTGDFVFAVLDGNAYGLDGQAGATVLDDVRSHYNVDNDRTCLISQSAGTTGGLELGFHIRQGWFAAYYIDDVVGIGDSPGQTGTQLGFAPWGQSNAGGNAGLAQALVASMQAAGYQMPNPAPYAGPGATMHGSLDGQLDAMTFMVGKSR